MWSVNKDDEPFEPAAVAVARECVPIVCSLWMSVETLLALKIKLTAWTCKLGVRGRAAPESAENEGEVFSAAERAFLTGFLAWSVP